MANKYDLVLSQMPLYTRFRSIDLELILARSSSDTTLAYRFGRNIYTNCSSVSHMDSRTVDTILVVIRLARTMGYGLFSINEMILTEAQEALAVASSNFFARSKLFCL